MIRGPRDVKCSRLEDDVKTGMENLAGEQVWCPDEVLGLGNVGFSEDSIEMLGQEIGHMKFLPEILDVSVTELIVSTMEGRYVRNVEIDQRAEDRILGEEKSIFFEVLG